MLFRSEAAENGKQVDVLVELKARFDEENNIEWSRLLERAGCHVVYGIEGLKVHSKLCLITRKTKDGISFITQIGTGLAGLDQLIDEHLVGQAVDLDADVAALAAGGGFNFAVYQIQQTVLQAMGCYQQILDRIHRFALIQCAENLGRFQTDFPRCGQEGKVGVQAACLFVVVAGANLLPAGRCPG